MRKQALVIGVNEYQHLRKLRKPKRDAEAFAEVLLNAEIGGFDPSDVKLLIDPDYTQLNDALDEFFQLAKYDDLLVLYFSGHGIVGPDGHPYLAATDTVSKPSFIKRAVSASSLKLLVDKGASRKYLFFDSCYSGGLGEFLKGDENPIGVELQGQATGTGRVILTASAPLKVAWEDDKRLGELEHSVFTHFLLQGIRTGDADLGRDGWIDTDELYQYVSKSLDMLTGQPGRYGETTGLLPPFIRNPRPMPLPRRVMDGMKSQQWYTREGVAKYELRELLASEQPEQADAARAALEQLANDDDERVASAARAVLGGEADALELVLEADREAARLAKLEQERKAKEDADREAARLAKLDADRKAQEEADREAARLAKLEQERKAKEDADREAARLAKLEQERKDKEDADREAARLAKLEQERKAQEDADRKAKLDAAREAERKLREAQAWVAPIVPEAAPATTTPPPTAKSVRRTGWQALQAAGMVVPVLVLGAVLLVLGGLGVMAVASSGGWGPVASTPTRTQLPATTAVRTATPTNTSKSTATATATPTPYPYAVALGVADGFAGGNEDWEPVAWVFDDDPSGATMMLVPPGCFMMGSESGESDEQPVHEQCFEEPFWIDETEVTRGQWQACVDAGVCQARPANQYSERGLQPVNYVSWTDAVTFCEWRGARLPTEREWEYAAAGPDGLVYPWGDDFDGDLAIWDGSEGFYTYDVGSRPGGASWVGALDLSGNVWEWVSSKYLPYPYEMGDGREDMTGDDRRVLRGGSFFNLDFDVILRAALRYWYYPSVEITSSTVFGAPALLNTGCWLLGCWVSARAALLRARSEAARRIFLRKDERLRDETAQTALPKGL